MAHAVTASLVEAQGPVRLGYAHPGAERCTSLPVSRGSNVHQECVAPATTDRGCDIERRTGPAAVLTDLGDFQDSKHLHVPVHSGARRRPDDDGPRVPMGSIGCGRDAGCASGRRVRLCERVDGLVGIQP